MAQDHRSAPARRDRAVGCRQELAPAGGSDPSIPRRVGQPGTSIPVSRRSRALGAGTRCRSSRAIRRPSRSSWMSATTTQAVALVVALAAAPRPRPAHRRPVRGAVHPQPDRDPGAVCGTARAGSRARRDVHVLLSMRDDFLYRCHAPRGVRAGLRRHHAHLGTDPRRTATRPRAARGALRLRLRG